MPSQIFSGKTVEDALQKALKVLGVSKETITYTVIEQSSKGFLGFGAKDARIDVRLKVEDQPDVSQKAAVITEQAPPVETKPTESVAPATEIPAGESVEDIGMAFLGPIFEQMAVKCIVQIEEKDQFTYFHIKGDDVGILIGRRGETLNALQLLLSSVINHQSEGHYRVVLDCENYRSRREEALANIAARMAAKARETGRRVSLEPMTAAERRLIHLALENEARVSAESIGEDPNRRIVIYPQK